MNYSLSISAWKYLQTICSHKNCFPLSILKIRELLFFFAHALQIVWLISKNETVIFIVCIDTLYFHMHYLQSKQVSFDGSFISLVNANTRLTTNTESISCSYKSAAFAAHWCVTLYIEYHSAFDSYKNKVILNFRDASTKGCWSAQEIKLSPQVNPGRIGTCFIF